MSSSQQAATIAAQVEPSLSSARLGHTAAFPAALWSSGARLAAIAVQLALIALVLQTWQIDSRAFRYQFAFIICLGFVVNHFLPLRFRLPFFSILSAGAIVMLLGATGAAYLFAAGLLLIAIASAPIPFAARVALLAIVGGAMAYLRTTSIIPGMTGVWPILGSMFMFRLLVYLHDVRTGVAPAGIWRSLAYFFMIPNACFPLFPIVDYKTFVRTYYNRDAFDIYQKGVDWIVRGIIQLILYRFVYQHLLIDRAAIADAGDVARYLVTNFLLYLKVSGNFHIIIGVLHLFGFNLPETHHKYILSSSFTDFWRRINIYWKDFIQKMFFFPVYFRVKKRGETFALVVATSVAFFATWALHIYQWFWLRGSVFFSWMDVAFWAILGVGVVLNVLYESKNTRRAAMLKAKPTWRSELSRALRTVAMFTFICLLWSMWNADSLGEWLTMLAKSRHISLADAALILGGAIALGVAAITMGRSSSERTDAPAPTKGNASHKQFWIEVTQSAVLAAALVVVGRNPLWFAPVPAVADTLDRLTSNRLNAQDIAKLERGYYEDLIDEARFNPELAELYQGRPRDWAGGTMGRMRDRPGFPNWEHVPNSRVVARGTVQTVNRWGMRDRDYAKQKPAGVYRIALLGDSNSFGSGVNDDEIFEHVLEEQLNRPAAAHDGPKYEILNFALGRYGPYCRLRILEEKAFEFQPDAVLFVSVNDMDWICRDVARCQSKRIKIPDRFVAEVVQKANLTPGLSELVAEHRLQPYALELVRGTYRQVVEQCRARGIEPIAVFLPRLDDRDWEADQLPQLLTAAKDAGFTVLDVTTAYRGVNNWNSLWVQRWDAHPNARGHQLIATMLEQKLRPHLVSHSLSPEGENAR